jgi:K+-transporting ATPase A subunit
MIGVIDVVMWIVLFFTGVMVGNLYDYIEKKMRKK